MTTPVRAIAVISGTVLSQTSANRFAGYAAAIVMGVLAACSKEPVELGAADYGGVPPAGCLGEARSGEAGLHDREETEHGILYSVRTPSNYDPGRAHPLLVVYAAAGQRRTASERFTGFTRAATAAGFVVAYADHRALSIRVLDDLATIPAAVARKWCVDTDQVFVAGHSDGGTAAAAMAFRSDDGLEPAGFAASAAGVRGVDLDPYQCPERTRVLILHSLEDELFPDFGADAALWWARCKQCDNVEAPLSVDGCLDYGACNGSSVRYCPGIGGHRSWPAKNEVILAFFR